MQSDSLRSPLESVIAETGNGLLALRNSYRSKGHWCQEKKKFVVEMD